MTTTDDPMQSFLATLPSKSGIYLFLDKAQNILYIGKAKNLKKRVQSYFSGHESNRGHISVMLNRFSSIQYIITQNEHDALILENSWIKEKKPPFNIVFRDDKTYQSLSIDLGHPFPGLKIVRKIDPSKKQILYGPFCLIGDIKNATQILLRFFQIRDCSDAEFKRRTRACLRYDLQLCSAPCVGKISAPDYLASIELLKKFLAGKHKDVLSHLKSKIKQLSDDLQFEKASEFHDRLITLQKMTNRDSAFGHTRGNLDFVLFEERESKVCFYLMHFRHGHLISTDTHFLKPPLLNENIYLPEFLERVYLNHTWVFPDQIVVKTFQPNLATLSSVLSSKANKKIFIRGFKTQSEKRIIEMAHENLQSLWQTQNVENQRQHIFMQKLKHIFHTEKDFNWIEVLDISHQSAKDCVGAKVAFLNARPLKQEYRKYHLKDAKKGDDYGGMAEMLNRRINESLETNTRPDLMILDGGRGHLNIASQVMDARNWKVPTLAISKESHAKNSFDTIHVINKKSPLALKKDDPFLLEVMKMRDEAHRFAIRFFKHTQHTRIFTSEKQPATHK